MRARSGRLRLLALVLALCPALFAQAGGYLITTVAGDGAGGFSGDNGPATSAELADPQGVAVDSAGNLYIADLANNRIRKVSNGVISTVAGNGTPGFSGDGGLATAAQLDQPAGVAVDSAGNLYIADCWNHRIRKVSNGVISTVAGNGTPGFSGDNGPATSAQLSDPTGVAVDSAGNLYIADMFSNRIRRVSNGAITTVAGNGTQGFSGDNGPATSAQLSNPYAVAVDSAGNLYIADMVNNRIRKVSNGVITTVAGGGTQGLGGDGGPATSAQLSASGVAVYASGSPLIADSGNNRIRQLVAAPSAGVGCVYSIDQSAQSFGAQGGSGSVGVLASATACPWLADSYADWITASPSGVASGTGLVAYTVSPNPDSAPRSGVVWIAGQSLTVKQSGVVCSLSAAPRSVSVAAFGLTGTSLTVTTDAPDCQWTAVANVAWILVSGGNSGTGGGTVTYTVGVNTGSLRTGTITVAGQKVYVNQAASGGSVASLASLSSHARITARFWAPLDQ